MSDKIVTRNQTRNNPQLQAEIDTYDPFLTRREIPRGDEEESFIVSGTSSEVSSPTSENSFSEKSSSTLINSSSSAPETSFFDESRNTSILLNSKMATAVIPTPVQPQVVSLRDAISVIPEFNGKNIPLCQFLEGCDEAKEMIGPESEANLARLVRSKITGEARQAISGQTFNTINSIKDFLKKIYAPAQTIPQLLGEMGNEFQRDEESVISFANRIRDIGSKILEVKRLENNGQVDANFRNSIQNTIIDSFKRGLKFEIEQRLINEDDANVNNLVQSAITIERKLAAQKNLRKVGLIRAEDSQPRVRRTFSCQVCNKDGHETSQCKNNLWCQHCNMKGHSLDKCFRVSKPAPSNKIICQLCNKEGHAANSCRNFQTCQLCKKTGHIAKECYLNKGSSPAQLICQYCNRVGHSADKCFLLNNKNTQKTKDPLNIFTCQICNKNGHEADSCRTQGFKLKECRYCKKTGHTIEECWKRKYNEEQRSGNGQHLQVSSATMEAPRKTQHSPLTNATYSLQAELLPFD